MTPPPPRNAATAQRSTTRHAGIDADDVVAAALDIVEEHGADALTMRRLAADLGVTTTTIYWHVGNRDELVVALIQRLSRRQAEVEVVGSTPRERIACAAANIWRNARAHRNVTSLATQVGATTMLVMPLEVALAAELEAGGLRGAVARDALRAILNLIAGFLVAAWRDEERVPTALRPTRLWAEVSDDRIGAATRRAMGEPPDLDALFDATLLGVVATFVPGDPSASSKADVHNVSTTGSTR